MWSGSPESVEALIAAGADIRTKNKYYEGSSLSWAIHCNQPHIEIRLRELPAAGIVTKRVAQGIIKTTDTSEAARLIAFEIVA